MLEGKGMVGGAGTRRIREVPVGRRGRLCLECGAHRPLYRVHGGPVKSERQHSLCFRCRRSLGDQVRAWQRHIPVAASPVPERTDLLWQGAASDWLT